MNIIAAFILIALGLMLLVDVIYFGAVKRPWLLRRFYYVAFAEAAIASICYFGAWILLS
jgi:hypothetical protein